MRLARIRSEAGAYHTMSRFVHGLRVFDVGSGSCPNARKFLGLMWKLAEFHEMTIVTYALLPTHFHILCLEPKKRRTSIEDAELVEKVRALNGVAPAVELAWQLKHLREDFQSPAAAEELKARYLSRMGNVSAFMKELKGRFAMWYNKRQERYGVLWSDRFKSVLVEGGTAMMTMAAYIDLNSVRAGLADDPKDYRWCGYSHAVAGNERAREGLMEVFAERGIVEWKSFARDYRKLLFCEGEERVPEEGEQARRGISPERVEAVLESGGELTLGELVRCRVRYFADGLAFGSAQFVEGVFEKNRHKFGQARKAGAKKMQGGELAGMRTMRDLRKTPITS